MAVQAAWKGFLLISLQCKACTIAPSQGQYTCCGLCSRQFYKTCRYLLSTPLDCRTLPLVGSADRDPEYPHTVILSPSSCLSPSMPTSHQPPHPHPSPLTVAPQAAVQGRAVLLVGGGGPDRRQQGIIRTAGATEALRAANWIKEQLIIVRGRSGEEQWIQGQCRAEQGRGWAVNAALVSQVHATPVGNKGFLCITPEASNYCREDFEIVASKPRMEQKKSSLCQLPVYYACYGSFFLA